MKSITLKNEGQFVAADVLMVALNTAPSGMSIDEIRKRCRVLERLAEANGTLVLEDADYSTLVEALRGSRFTLADPALLRVIDAVLAPN